MPNETCLHDAAFNNNPRLVNNYLADLNQPYATHKSASKIHHEIVTWLDKDRSPRGTDGTSGALALTAATAMLVMQKVPVLRPVAGLAAAIAVASGAYYYMNPRIPDDHAVFNWPPLFFAAYAGSLDCAKALIQAGADLTVAIDGYDFLKIASQRGHDTFVKAIQAEIARHKTRLAIKNLNPQTIPVSRTKHVTTTATIPAPSKQPLVFHSADEARQLIKDKKALVKTVPARLNNDKPIEHIFKLLKNPETYRPVRNTIEGLPANVDRTKITNTRTLQKSTRTVNSTRGQAKPKGWEFSKKEPVSLLPSHGKMHLYPIAKGTGFLLNRDKVRFKYDEHGLLLYGWKTNAVTNPKKWVGDDRGDFPQSVTLREIEEDLDKYVQAGQAVPEHNELLACLSKNSVTAIFAYQDDRALRLNALRIKYKFKEEFGIVLPLLVITSDKGDREYTAKEQIDDIHAAQQKSPFDIEQQILLDIDLDANRLITMIKADDCYRVLALAKNYEWDKVKHIIFADNYSLSPDLFGKLLREAAAQKETEFAIELLMAKPDIPWTEDAQQSLICAVQNHDMELLKALLYYNADVNVKNQYQHTPLELAFARDNITAIELLAAAGGRIELAYAQQAAINKQWSAILAFVKYNTHNDAHTRDIYGALLLEAAKQNDTAAALALLAVRATVNWQNNNNIPQKSAVEWATSFNNSTLLQALFAHGARMLIKKEIVQTPPPIIQPQSLAITTTIPLTVKPQPSCAQLIEQQQRKELNQQIERYIIAARKQSREYVSSISRTSLRLFGKSCEIDAAVQRLENIYKTANFKNLAAAAQWHEPGKLSVHAALSKPRFLKASSAGDEVLAACEKMYVIQHHVVQP